MQLYQAETRGVRVKVTPSFLPERSDSNGARFVWAYCVELENGGAETVHLVDRRWIITDARGRVEQVQGPGVVGEQPVLKPGDSYEYASGCPLPTDSGAMVGHCGMVTAAGERFNAAIPAFSLHIPGAERVVN